MFDSENKEFSEHLVTINRVAKVVKGGRRFGFAAIMIVGDNKGKVGYGTGKAKEVPEAVRKATENAKTRMIRVHLKDNRTLHHDIVGRFGAGKVILRSAAPGTGIDSASGLSGWLNTSDAYAGSGVPGSNTGNGGNGSDGCAFDLSNRVLINSSLNGGYKMTLGEENMSNATGNVVLVRVALNAGQEISQLYIQEA